jgi:hypothetical protein
VSVYGCGAGGHWMIKGQGIDTGKQGRKVSQVSVLFYFALQKVCLDVNVYKSHHETRENSYRH